MRHRTGSWPPADSGESDSVGGFAILIARTLSPARPEVTEHIRGRVLEARLAQGEGVLSLRCVHDFELGSSEVRKLVAELHRLADEHGRAPLGRRAAFMGDLNFSAAQAGEAGAAKRRADRALASALERWVELPAPGSTHASPDGGSFSSIDRVWLLVPRSLLAVARPRAAATAQPEWISAKGLNDPSPVAVEWPRQNALPLDRRPVPQTVAEDDSTQDVLAQLGAHRGRAGLRGSDLHVARPQAAPAGRRPGGARQEVGDGSGGGGSGGGGRS